MANERIKYHYVDIGVSLLDARAKEDFIGLVLGVMEKMVFMEDAGLSLAKVALYLCQFEPRTIDFFYERMVLAFA